MNHRDEILAEEKVKKRWLNYYQNNREAILEKRRQKYHLQTTTGLMINALTTHQAGFQQNVATDTDATNNPGWV